MVIFNSYVAQLTLRIGPMADDEFAGESVGDGDERGSTNVGNERREKALRLGNSWGPGPGRKLGYPLVILHSY